MKIGSGGALGLSILILIFGFGIRDELELHFYPRYTIGTFEDEGVDGHLVKKITYKYVVDDKEYDAMDNNLGVINGKRYFVKFSSINNSISRFMQNNVVPDSIVNAPSDGWEKLPVK